MFPATNFLTVGRGKIMQTLKLKFTLVVGLCLHLSLASFASSNFPEFDRGPDLSDPMQAELVQLLSEMPFLPGISEQLQVLVPSYKRGQKMRPDFGAMPLRGFLTPNSISVLVIGQDGTHIAEGANRPGIAGFGGRVHDMLKHFGIVEGVFFTNLYVNTISGQYGSRNTPVLVDGKSIRYTNVIENRQWLLTHEGAYGEWRNKFLSWVIRNNLKSLRMVMMLGQAGKDAGANLVTYLGGSVKAREYVGDGSKYQVPFFAMTGAGGNNEWAYPVTKDNKDVIDVIKVQRKIRDAFLPNYKAELAQAEENLKELENELEEEESSANPSSKNIKKLKSKIKLAKSKVAFQQNKINFLTKKRMKYDGDGAGQSVAKDIFSKFPQEAKEVMVFSRGGPQENGVLHPQQFGGWDLRTMTVNGEKTRSIKGLRIPCAGSKAGPCQGGVESVEAPDVVFVGSPHPTSLSMGEMERKGSAAVKVHNELLVPLRGEMNRGWIPPQPEKGRQSPFLSNDPYQYGRGLIPESHGDPGITALRLLPVSTATRKGKAAIVIGARKGFKFSSSQLKQMEKEKPAQEWLTKSNRVLTGRPMFSEWLGKFDRGPEGEYVNLLFKSLDAKKILWAKSEYRKEAEELREKNIKKIKDKEIRDADDDKKDEVAKRAPTADQLEEAYEDTLVDLHKKFGMKAFNMKSHPNAGFFGHYRGTFKNPKVVILADPHGQDSFITSKAMTGSRGQYLQGLMNDLGVGKDYLVIRTVPFSMDGASEDEWAEVLEQTKDYRTNLFKKLREMKPILVADGPYAAKELRRITRSKKRFIAIERGESDDSGFAEAAPGLLKKLDLPEDLELAGERADIPREHLTWIARVWEGTSGDRVVLQQEGSEAGKAFAIVAPDWARKNKVHFSEKTRSHLRVGWSALAAAGEPMPYEKMSEFVKRRAKCVSEQERKQDPDSKKEDCLDTVKDPLFPSQR